MAALSGKKAKVQRGGKDIYRLNSWTLDIDTNILDVTVFTTDNVLWRTNIAGLSGARGSLSGFWDMVANTSGQKAELQAKTLTPTTAELILYVDSSGGENYRMSSLLSRQSVSASIDGTVDVSWDFVATGAVTYSTAT